VPIPGRGGLPKRPPDGDACPCDGRSPAPAGHRLRQCVGLVPVLPSCGGWPPHAKGDAQRRVALARTPALDRIRSPGARGPNNATPACRSPAGAAPPAAPGGLAGRVPPRHRLIQIRPYPPQQPGRRYHRAQRLPERRQPTRRNPRGPQSVPPPPRTPHVLTHARRQPR